jgi:hypothetical protein
MRRWSVYFHLPSIAAHRSEKLVFIEQLFAAQKTPARFDRRAATNSFHP